MTPSTAAMLPSAEQLLSALALSGCGLMIHRGAAPLYINPTLAGLLAIDGASRVADDFSAIGDKDSAARLRAQGAAVLEGRAAAIELVRIDGVEGPDGMMPRWLEVRATAIDHDGAPAALHTFMDVSEQRRHMGDASHMRELFGEIVSGLPVATFVVDAEHRVTHWNRAAERVTGVSAETLLGTADAWRGFYPAPRPTLADIVMSGGDANAATAYYGEHWRRSVLIPDAYESEGFFPALGPEGRWLYFLAAPLRDAHGCMVGAVETLQDISERKRAEAALACANERLETEVEARTRELAVTNQQLASDIAKREVAETELLKRYAELTELNCRLHDAQAQLVQSEKLASIGQLAAGVAHEINNPIGYVLSNITTLGRYLSDIFSLFDAFEAVERTLPEADPQRAAIVALKQSLDFDFLKEDLPALLRESQEGATRVRQIVQDLKDFSRVDHSKEWMLADIHAGLDSTLNVVNNELKYKAEVVRDYGQLPSIHCIPSQLNQVFMNLLVNAAHAIETRGTITIRTEAPDADHISVSVSDTGSGIPADTCKRIFEPFFTTKPVGKGTGLGLSLSYGIVQKHHGEITVDSTVGAGTTFRVVLPVNPPEGEAVVEAAET